MMNQAAAISAILLVIGCNSRAMPSGEAVKTIRPAELKEATLYVAGMNQRLKIL